MKLIKREMLNYFISIFLKIFYSYKNVLRGTPDQTVPFVVLILHMVMNVKNYVNVTRAAVMSLQDVDL